jgi:hypothetical protein
MKIKKTLLSLALITSLSIANEITEKIEKYEDRFCKETTSKIIPATKLINVCASLTVSYPKVSSQNKNLAKYINSEISKVLNSKINVKKHVLKTIKNMPSTGEEKYSIEVKLLAITSKTFSLESYLMYDDPYDERAGTQLRNFDKKTGREIKIDELFIKGYEKNLLKIAKQAYEKKGIELDEDISFTIAKNIGISKDGLHLEYNILEIGSRAVSLVIPYASLKEIINPKSYLASF